MPIDKFLGAEAAAVIAAANGSSDFALSKVGGCCIEIEGLDDVFREYFKMGRSQRIRSATKS